MVGEPVVGEPNGIAVLPEALRVVKLPRDASIPTWALSSQLFSITKTADELSVLCEGVLRLLETFEYGISGLGGIAH